MIERVGGRDCLVAHVDQLQRNAGAAQEGAVLASHQEPNHNGVTGRPKPGGTNLARPWPDDLMSGSLSQSPVTYIEGR